MLLRGGTSKHTTGRTTCSGLTPWGPMRGMQGLPRASSANDPRKGSSNRGNGQFSVAVVHPMKRLFISTSLSGAVIIPRSSFSIKTSPIELWRCLHDIHPDVDARRRWQNGEKAVSGPGCKPQPFVNQETTMTSDCQERGSGRNCCGQRNPPNMTSLRHPRTTFHTCQVL